MDPLIENLKSTTFYGKRLTRRQIAEILRNGEAVSVAEPEGTGTHPL